VLEVGCGRGHTLMELTKRSLASETVGVELVPIERTADEVSAVTRYIVGNIEFDNLDLPDKYFDVLICADVLEHLVDPWKIFRRLLTLLRPHGIAIVSMPNVREVRTMYNVIVRGDFAYCE